MTKHIGPNQLTNFETLAKAEMATWTGWVIYYWDMSHCAALFAKKPKRDERTMPRRTWDFANAREGVNVDFLVACGVPWPYDNTREFYYGGDLAGSHPPLAIKLTLPKPLLEQLRLL